MWRHSQGEKFIYWMITWKPLTNQKRRNPAAYCLRLSQVRKYGHFTCLLKTILVSLPYLINWYCIVFTDLSTLFSFKACCMMLELPHVEDREATSRYMFYQAVTLEMGGCLHNINSIPFLFVYINNSVANNEKN